MFTITGFADELGPDFESQMKVWSEMGLKYFELRSAWGTNVMLLTDEQVYKVKEIADRYGIKVSCIGSPIGKTNIEDPIDFEMKRLERAFWMAKLFGCGRVRVFSFYCKEGSILDHREEVMDRLSKMAAFAAENGIELLHENEANIYGQYSRESAEIAATLKSKYFGLVFDPANYSVAKEDALEAEKNMHPYITYFHCKDYSGHDMDMAIPGTGVSYIPEVLDRLRERDMFVSMEPHLDHAGQFGGQTAPEKYKEAVQAVKDILDRLQIKWQ
ncbi:MAG: sugar phosphate isomerase/epimerase [Sphaerochaetaceae bacterium]|nr:sugar phosphate isomerase/epimerase [Sphaerochaetaceae bacterium]